jgi:hypothetical protein
MARGEWFRRLRSLGRLGCGLVVQEPRVVFEWKSKNDKFLQQAARIDGRADGRIEGRRRVKTPPKSFRVLSV